MGISEKLDDST